MARLVVMQDPLRGGVREHHHLTPGATLADELRRLYPSGFGRPWVLHKAQALAEGEIDASLHEGLIVDDDVTYIVTVKPGGPVIPYIVNMIVAFAVSYFVGVVSSYFARRNQTVNPQTEQEGAQSPNNQIAGQSNRLRGGARVPDILGKVRAYPDLMTAPVERWYWPHTQQIVQHFVVGRGEYLLEQRRLGDTLFTAIDGISWADFPPGVPVSNVQAIRQAPNVDGISLIAQDSATTAAGVTFNAAAKTVLSSARIGIVVGSPYFVTGTLFNTADFFVTSVPPDDQVVGPYIYGLDGPVVNETSNAIFNADNYRGGEWQVHDYHTRGVPNEVMVPVNSGMHVGDLIVLDEASWGGGGGSFYFEGKITYVEHGGPYTSYTWFRVVDMAGVAPTFAVVSLDTFNTYWAPAGGPLRGLPTDVPVPLAGTPQYTSWVTAPIEEPDEIWLDFEFPQGLVHYNAGNRYPYAVSIQVEFRSVAVPATIVTRVFTYTASSNITLRVTEIVLVTDLALAGPIEVRTLRLTAIPDDTSVDQYVQDTRWKSLRAVKNLLAQVYPDVTITRLVVFNSQSAASVGELSYNTVATRILPTWTGSAWTDPAPTEKWADNLVARIKASDGANKPDTEIDLAGIYAVQAILDAADGGDQGKISMTLDELQDIDVELQTIAAVVRCQVYRVGRKLFVTRDEGGKTPLALFTGRSKSPDGEQVHMAMQNDTENDAVVVTWVDRENGWKQREYQFPEDIEPVNALHVLPLQATWAQAWRRAQYEWNRQSFRRDTISMEATEEARLIHIGDVVQVTDDIANLAQSAGEVFTVAGLTLTLDREVDLSAGGFTIMLRAQDGRSTDSMAITQGASLREVILNHAAAFPIRGRDEALGTIFAIYQSASAVIRPWLVINLEPGMNYTRLIGVNWRTEVFDGDIATLPAEPEFSMRGLPRDSA